MKKEIDEDRLNEFMQICQRHRLKITPQRVAIYQHLFGLGTHPTADAVYQIVKKEYPKRGKVLLEQKLKETLSGIRYKARITCLKAKGTPAENLACTVSKKVGGWKFETLEKNRKELDRQLESLLNVLRSKIPFVPENMYIFEKIEDIRKEEDLLERYKKVSRLVGLIPGARMTSRR